MTKNEQKKTGTNHPYTGEWVILCTDENKKGVFYGKLKEYNREKDYAVLEKARMIVYWSRAVKGVLGLAVEGVKDGCRVSSPVREIDLNGISTIMKASKEAQKSFEKEIIWS